MGNPTLITGYGQFYYLCDRDPTSTELDVLDPANNGVGVYVNIPDFKYAWFNTTSKEIWWCTDNTFNDMYWNKLITQNNIGSYTPANPVAVADGGTGANNAATARTNLGLNVNSARAASSVTLSLNTSRQPNTTHDIFVSANISFSAVLSLSAEVDMQLSSDNSTWVTYGKAKQQVSIAANIIQQLYALVPAGYYYKFIASGSGYGIDSIYETTL